MKNFILLTFVAFLLGISNINAQFWTLDFETAGGYTTTPATEFTDGGNDYFIRTDGSDITGTYNSPQGSWYFAAQDIDGDQPTVPCILSIDNINIAGQSGLSFAGLFAEDSGIGWDLANDKVDIEYNIDGGAWQNLIWIRIDQSETDGLNGPCSIDTDFDGTGEGIVITNTFQEITANISGTGSLLNLRITINLTSGDEDIAFDNLRLFSTVPCATPTLQASNITFSNTSMNSMDISWTDGDGSSRVVVINTINSFTNLIDGTTYTGSTTYLGGEQIIYVGTGNSVSVSNLSANTTYYVKVFEYNCTDASSLYLNSDNTNNPNSNTTNAPCSGATTQVSNLIFSNVTDGSFTLNWTNGDGDYRLVVVKQGSVVISEPVDGTTYTASANFGSGSDIGANEFVVYSGSSNTVTVSNLQSETEYYVAVFEFCAPSGNGSQSYLTPGETNNTTTQADYPSTCFEIESILVDACARYSLNYQEGPNEMVRFRVGGTPLDVADMTVVWATSNLWRGIVQNATTAAITAYLNGTIQSCGHLIEPAGGILPAGANVLLITSSDTLIGSTRYFDLAGNSFTYLSDTLYVIYQQSNSSNLGGHFSNYSSSGTRNFSISFSSPVGCSDAVSYDCDLYPDNDGDRVDYDWDNTAHYVNDGCQAPFEPAGVTAINVNQVSNICFGDILEIDGTAVGSYTNLYWETSGSGSFTDPTSLNTTYLPGATESGQITLSLTAESGSCGTVNDTLLVTIYQLPTPTISNDTTICNGDVATLTAGGGTSYSWSGSLGSTATVNASPTTTTAYTVTVSENGCSSTTSVNVNVNPLPNVTANATDTDICIDEQITLTGSGDAATYTWNNSVTDGVAFTPTNTTYTVTATDANGCEKTASIDVTVTEVLANAGSNQTINNGETATLSGSASGGTGYTYSWEPASLLDNASIASPTTVSMSGTTIFTLTVTDNTTGCQDTAQVTITVEGGVLSIIASSDLTEICEGETINLSSTPSGGTGTYTSFAWSSNPSGFTSANEDPGTVSPTETTTYTVTVTDGASNTATASITVTVNSNPTLSLSNVSSCTGNTEIIGPSTTYSSYEWSTGAATQTISVTVSGTHYLTVTDANGCQASDDIIVTFSDDVDIPIGNFEVCEGETVILDATSNFDTYLWSTGEATQTINVTTSGVYSVQATSSTSCNGTGTSIVNFTANPTANIGPDTAKCTGETIVLETLYDSQYTYQWNNGSTTNTTSVTTSGDYSVTVMNALNTACKDIDSVIVTFYPLPEPDFSSTETLIEGSVLELDAGNFPGSTYIWSTGETTQTIEVNEKGDYTVTITDAHTCVNTATVTVILDNGLVQPYNVFTPDGDGYNDYWVIRNIGSYDKAEIYVFNRNGNKVFESFRYDLPWNGKYNSKDLPAATYFYMIDLGDGSDIIKGTVTIVR